MPAGTTLSSVSTRLKYTREVCDGCSFFAAGFYHEIERLSEEYGGTAARVTVT